MRIKGLIRRLAQIESKYGNVRIVTWSGREDMPMFMWQKSGAGYPLKDSSLRNDEKIVLIIQINKESR